MTPKEAIDYLIDPIGKRDQHDKAIDLAIEALKTYQTCEQIRWERDIAIQQLADLGYSLGEKPKASCSETPNNLDCISRQAAINAIEFGITYAKAINKETGEVKELFRESNDELRKAADRIKQLPSVQPDIIRCKDCVNYRNYYDTNEQEERYVCGLDGFIWKPEGYCSYAERKNGGQG